MQPSVSDSSYIRKLENLLHNKDATIAHKDATIAALKAENERLEKAFDAALTQRRIAVEESNELREEVERLKAILDRVIRHIDETARGPYYIAIPRLYGELGKILRGEEP